jgi:HSP20 family protein
MPASFVRSYQRQGRGVRQPGRTERVVGCRQRERDRDTSRARGDTASVVKFFASAARYSVTLGRPPGHAPNNRAISNGTIVATMCFGNQANDAFGFISGRSNAMTKFLQSTEAANPFAFMRRITEELDRTFGLRADVPGLPAFYPKMWAPVIEVFELDQKFVVRVDLPGLKKEDVKVEVTHDELTIEGERHVDKEEKEKGLYRTERTYGSFFRRIGIPEHVKAESAVATFKNGVLEIQMSAIPVPEVKKRTIEVLG